MTEGQCGQMKVGALRMTPKSPARTTQDKCIVPAVEGVLWIRREGTV